MVTCNLITYYTIKKIKMVFCATKCVGKQLASFKWSFIGDDYANNAAEFMGAIGHVWVAVLSVC